MRNRPFNTVLRTAALAALLATACGDVDRFPSTSLTIKPDPVTDAVLALDDSSGAAVLTWTAPRTHGGTSALRRYDIRFDYAEEFVWSRAERVAAPPVPGEAGEVQMYRFTYPRRGRVISAAVRSIDDSGNLSEEGNVAALLIPGIMLSGTTVNFLTGQPPGAPVTLVTPEFTRTALPDANGSWSFPDLPESAVSIRIAGPGATPEIFPVEVGMTLTAATHLELRTIPYQESVVHPSQSMLRLFKEAVGVRGSELELRTWPTRPLDVFVPEYVTPTGLDYRVTALAAIDRWMEVTGVELFRVVETPPVTGVRVEFRSAAEMGTQIGFTTHVNAPDGTPERSDIAIVNSFENAVVLRRTMLHELGHTLRLSHLPAGFLMYGGQPLPDDPTADEIWFVRLLCAMPNGTDLSVYREVE